MGLDLIEVGQNSVDEVDPSKYWSVWEDEDVFDKAKKAKNGVQ